MPSAPIEAGQLHYELAGSGPPVLFAAGLAGLGRFWSAQVAALAPRFTVITYDHRGNGQSTRSPPPYSIDAMLRDVVTLLDHLHVQRVRFVGHSTGGVIGQRFATLHPHRVDRLVLSATWTHADAYFRRLFTLRRELLARGESDLYARLSTLLLYSPDWIAQRDAELGDESTNVRAEDLAILMAKIDALLGFDGRADLERIACPTLVIAARDDVTVPAHFASALVQAIRGAALRVLDSGGHYFPITRAPEFSATVGEFLEGRP